MGNNHTKQNPSIMSLLNNSTPTHKNDKSRILNHMVVKVIKKIQDPGYWNKIDENFMPKIIEVDQLIKGQIDINSNNCDPTPKIHPMNNYDSINTSNVLKDNSNYKKTASSIHKPLNNPKMLLEKENQCSTIESYKSNSTSFTTPQEHKRLEFQINNNSMISQIISLTDNKNNNANKSKTKYSGVAKPINRIASIKSNNLARLSSLKTPSKLNNSSDISQETETKQTLSGNSMIKSILSSKPKSISNLNSPLKMVNSNQGQNEDKNIIKKLSKKQFYINCNFEKKLFMLPTDVIFNILNFILDDYLNLILVSPIWYFKIHETFDSKLVEIDNSFTKSYIDIMAFKRGFFSIRPIKFSDKKGIRMDRNIIAEPLPVLIGKTIIISYDYELKNKKGITYKATFKFDVIKRGSRIIWIYKEECQHNYDDIKLALIQPIMPICIHDNIKFAINFYNMNGLLNLNNIKWQKPIIENTPTIPLNIDYNDIHMMNKNRICEVEEMYPEWTSSKYFDNVNNNNIDLDIYQPQLKLKDLKWAGIDIITLKSLYIANGTGKVMNSLNNMGLNIEIFDHDQDLITEIKRIGLYIDLDCSLQLRVGDKLVFYLSKSQ